MLHCFRIVVFVGKNHPQHIFQSRNAVLNISFETLASALFGNIEFLEIVIPDSIQEPVLRETNWVELEDLIRFVYDILPALLIEIDQRKFLMGADKLPVGLDGLSKGLPG